MKIALLSYADIDNYGDTFFPYAFSYELKKRLPSLDIDYITNLPVVIEGVKSIPYSREIIGGYDAVILCGGETVHNWDENVWWPIYYRISRGTFTRRPSDIVFDWAQENIRFKAWFSVGVPPVQPNCWDSIVNSLKNLDYISLRGLLSKKNIENESYANNPNIDIVPDIGWIFKDHISNDCTMVARRHNLGNIFDQPYCIVQFHDSTYPPVKDVASVLVEHQRRTGIHIYLLPIIKPWNDQKTMEYIKDASKNELVLLPDTLSFLEIGAVLLNCSYFCGSSMHGAITALSSGKPAGVLHPLPGTKLQDLFGAAYMPKLFVNEWDKLDSLMMRLFTDAQNNSTSINEYSTFMRSVLARKIDDFCNVLQEKVIR